MSNRGHGTKLMPQRVASSLAIVMAATAAVAQLEPTVSPIVNMECADDERAAPGDTLGIEHKGFHNDKQMDGNPEG